ncbi:MAG: HAMP domain-containing histidine kinase [Nitrospinae bacterium]|nr:HAMP domain-containing histidine kinase [Nitrospinota bacterium]
MLNKEEYIKLLTIAAPRTTAAIFDKYSTALLEQNAALSDNKVNDQLLKTLVMKYVQAESELKKLDELKNKLLGMAAHDLRNPLASIRGFSEILLEDSVDAETRKEFLGVIFNVSEEMLRLLNDLLDISQIQSGKFELRKKAGALDEVVKRRIQLNQVIAARKDIKIEMEVESSPLISFDHERIGQALDNFLSNAIKFSPRGSTITVRLKADGMWSQVEVADEGPGIPDEERGRLFGEFQRLSSVPTGGEKSTGLGLAIVSKIVKTHGGEVGVKRGKEGKGSVFFFALPVIT